MKHPYAIRHSAIRTIFNKIGSGRHVDMNQIPVSKDEDYMIEIYFDGVSHEGYVQSWRYKGEGGWRSEFKRNYL